jgi:hypothetical protein
VGACRGTCPASATRAGELRNDKDPSRVFRHNGIDRLVNDGGYSAENSVPCCWTCNRMKSDMSAADFLRLCRAIAARHPSV